MIRNSQIELFSSDELSLILYIYNVLDPIVPVVELDQKSISFLRMDMLVNKLVKHESSLNESGKLVYSSLMEKLQRSPVLEAEHFYKTEYIQLEFIF